MTLLEEEDEVLWPLSHVINIINVTHKHDALEDSTGCDQQHIEKYNLIR